MPIKPPQDIQKQSNCFVRRVPGFEVNCRKLAIPLSWWLSWFITMKGIELINLYSKTVWNYFRSADDSGIIIVSNYSTETTNNLLSNVDSCTECTESYCINVFGIRSKQMMIVMNLRGQVCWGSDNV